MAALVDSPSPAHSHNDSTSLMGSSHSPLFSPSSDKKFWSNLRSRVDSLIEDRNNRDASFSVQLDSEIVETDKGKRLKEDSMLLLRGFDSVAHTLSQLSSNIDNALQGARDLAKSPTLTEIFHSKLKKEEYAAENPKERQSEEEDNKKGTKRKFDPNYSSDDQQDESHKENEQIAKNKHMKRAKNLAVSMATKASSFARELKSVKSDLSFVQERCSLLEEENRRLRDGFTKGVRPEEDDLVRLQLEALLGEKSRLANENANLIRENQCLHQLLEYHKVTSEDLSASYEQAVQGMCLDFDSPIDDNNGDEDYDNDGRQKHGTGEFNFSANLDDCFSKEE